MEGRACVGFEVGDALFEVAEIVDTRLHIVLDKSPPRLIGRDVVYLQYCKFMHLLILARRNHIL